MDTTKILEYMVLGASNHQEMVNEDVSKSYQSLYHLANVFFDGIVSGLIGIDEHHTYDDIALEWMPRFKKAGDQVRDVLAQVDDEENVMAAMVDDALQWKLLQMDASLLHIVCAGYDVDQDEADDRFNVLAYEHPDWAERLAHAMEGGCSCHGDCHDDCSNDHCCHGESDHHGHCCHGEADEQTDHCCKDKEGHIDSCCKHHHDKHGECCQKGEGHHDGCCKNKNNQSQGSCHNREKTTGHCCKDKGQQSGCCQKGNHQSDHGCRH